MRECEIDLVAEHGEAALVGFSSGQTHFSLLRTLVSPVDGLSLVRLRFFFPPVKADIEDDDECNFLLL